MPSFDLGVAHVICSHCKKRIRRDQQDKSVFIRVWDKDRGRYIGHGPLHADCGKAFNQIAQKTSAASKP